MIDPQKKGAVGPFEVWHTGPRLYEVRRAGEKVWQGRTLNSAYGAAEQLQRNQRFAERVAAEINRGEM